MKEYFMDHPMLSIFLRVFGKRHITLVTDDPALYILRLAIPESHKCLA